MDLISEFMIVCRAGWYTNDIFYLPCSLHFFLPFLLMLKLIIFASWCAWFLLYEWRDLMLYIQFSRSYWQPSWTTHTCLYQLYQLLLYSLLTWVWHLKSENGKVITFHTGIILRVRPTNERRCYIVIKNRFVHCKDFISVEEYLLWRWEDLAVILSVQGEFLY